MRPWPTAISVDEPFGPGRIPPYELALRVVERSLEHGRTRQLVEIGGGANVLVFTTGRGSVFGCKPAPSIKVATNTPMYRHMIDDMDINAGVILEGTSVEQVGREIFETILDVASGRKTKSEQLGYGEDEYAPWAIGPTL